MHIEIHQVNDINIAEVTADHIIINNTEDGLDLLGNLYYQDVDRIILYEQNITPAFFDLKSGIAGEILQKFTNYQVRLALIGDWNKYAHKNLQDFFYESNKGRQVNFVHTLEGALEALSRK